MQCKRSEPSLALRSILALRIQATFFTSRCQSSRLVPGLPWSLMVVMVPGTLALIFDIDLAGGHANNYLGQNVSRALVSRLTVTFGGTPVQDTNGYDIYKTFEDLFLSAYERDEMLMEGIQSTKSCKIRSNAPVWVCIINVKLS